MPVGFLESLEWIEINLRRSRLASSLTAIGYAISLLNSCSASNSLTGAGLKPAAYVVGIPSSPSPESFQWLTSHPRHLRLFIFAIFADVALGCVFSRFRRRMRARMPVNRSVYLRPSSLSSSPLLFL